MDDFTRDQKRLNNLWIKLDKHDEDSSRILLSEALHSPNLDPLVVNILRTKLEDSKLRTMDSTWFSYTLRFNEDINKNWKRVSIK